MKDIEISKAMELVRDSTQLPSTVSVAREQIEKTTQILDVRRHLSREFETLNAYQRERDLALQIAKAPHSTAIADALKQATDLDFGLRGDWHTYFESIASKLAAQDFVTVRADEIRRMTENPLGGAFMDLLVKKNSLSELTERFAKAHEPWARLQKERESLDAALRLSGIGEALHTLAPFDLDFSSRLRTEFGDWTEAPEPPEAVYSSPEARTAYYEDRGLNKELTDFPEAAFAETLDTAELCENYLESTDLAEFVAVESNPELAAAQRRSALSFQLLHSLEVELRAFVDRMMSEKYGPKWVDRMGTLKQQWEETAAKRKAGGHEVSRLIEAADFTDYERIICKNDHFREVFQPYFIEKYSVQESFRRLRPLRNQTMHAGPVTKEDVLFVVTEVARIRKAILATV